MRKLKYIIFGLFFFSCNSNEANKEVFESLSVDDVVEADSEIEIEDSEYFVYEKFSQEKLQELYDLISLKENHPEFTESIKLQLENYTSDSLEIKTDENVVIKNLKLAEAPIQVSDAIEKMKLHYEVVTANSTKKDSIWAIVTTNEILFDGEKVISKKIKFEKILQ